MFNSNFSKGHAIALIGAFVLSMDTLFLRLIDSDPAVVAFWRGVLMFVAGGGVFLAIHRFSGHSIVKYSLKGYAVALFYGAASIFFTFSAMSTGVANLLIILSTTPLWAAIGSYLFLKEGISAKTITSCLLAFLGMLVIFTGKIGTGLNSGDFFALMAAFCMAGAFILSRVCKDNLLLAPCLGGGMSAVFLLPFVISDDIFAINNPLFMLIEGGVIMPVALGCLAVAPRFIRADKVSLFLLLETILGPFWAYIFLNEPVSTYTFLGGFIVISALLFNVSRA
ncbi:DMT family transporter [Halomonas sp. Y3]|uniref:DMT family transporter n=1 Tax=Halomonas sp. Y3 TaxID=2956797 RepID=UPI00209D1149|nr:DMT family transporter [Halomonas sp. Y3]